MATKIVNFTQTEGPTSSFTDPKFSASNNLPSSIVDEDFLIFKVPFGSGSRTFIQLQMDGFNNNKSWVSLYASIKSNPTLPADFVEVAGGILSIPAGTNPIAYNIANSEYDQMAIKLNKHASTNAGNLTSVLIRNSNGM
jgi:hypothetical protein